MILRNEAQRACLVLINNRAKLRIQHHVTRKFYRLDDE